jgi:curli biogenesis system outer membrane secretion channel CsgG
MNRIAVAWMLVVLASGAEAQPKKRVAVMNFEYGTVQSSVQAVFGTNQDIGKGISDLLVDRLVNGGAYSVIERKQLDKILAEQNFSNSDRADATTAAKIGRVLGVDAIVVGSITQFGRDDKRTNVGGSAIGGITGRYGIGGVSKTKSTAVCAITARLINTTTAEILASASARGESKRSGTGLLGAGGSSMNQGGGGIDMASSNFANTIIGEAVTAAVTDLAGQLGSRASALPVTIVQIDALVADVTPDGTMTINAGSRSGVKVGDRLEVKRKSREIRDPATGKVLRRVESQLGELLITEVDEGSAVGKYTGSAPAKVGDSAGNPK